MKVTSEITNYDESAKPKIRINSHWSNSRLVEIWFDEDNKRTVSARELEKALKNATNT